MSSTKSGRWRAPTTLVAILISAATVLAPSVATASPRVAPAVPSGCTSTNLCFWVNVNYSDGPGRLSGDNASWFAFRHSSCQNGTWADCASSIFNNGVSCTAHVYLFTGFGPPRLDIPRGTGYADLTQVLVGQAGLTWNDNIQSNNWC